VSVRFWLNTALVLVTPGGFGYERVLREHRAKLVAAGQAPVRTGDEDYTSSDWAGEGADGIRKRQYARYDDYVEHQKKKFDEIIRLNGGLGRRATVHFRLRMYRLFRPLVARLPRDARVLCAGARQGTEVEVLRELGFRNAYGIDLNPGPSNPFVVPGDFMHIAEPDGALDLAYCNALDHAFDVRGFFREQARVLKPTGYGLYEIALVKPSAFEAVQWESADAVLQVALESFTRVEESSISRDGSWKAVLLSGPRPAAA
jgi:hypothetical protein